MIEIPIDEAPEAVSRMLEADGWSTQYPRPHPADTPKRYSRPYVARSSAGELFDRVAAVMPPGLTLVSVTVDHEPAPPQMPPPPWLHVLGALFGVGPLR